MQKYSSAETSINASKLPAIYGKLAKHNIHDCSLLDYGCGKYLKYIKTWCKARNIKYLPYDAFNQPQKVNEASLLAASDTSKSSPRASGTPSADAHGNRSGGSG